MKHKHAELIHAWAEGAKIQFRYLREEWTDAIHPGWDRDFEYRIKPEENRMNKRIRELAEEAGFNFLPSEEDGVWIPDGYWHEELERFAELVRQDEREKCAKLCEELHDCEPEPRPDDCATAIRGRTE
jgi:hypothetical protein